VVVRLWPATVLRRRRRVDPRSCGRRGNGGEKKALRRRLRDQYTLGAAAGRVRYTHQPTAIYLQYKYYYIQRLGVTAEPVFDRGNRGPGQRHGCYKRPALATSPTSCRPIDVFVRHSCLPPSLSNY